MPPKRSAPEGYKNARLLRKDLTPAEVRLWAYLRRDKLNGVSFRRQHAIGNFIVDFVSVKNKLVIELDGSQHLKQEEYDVERSAYLESQGYKVIRFWNNQVVTCARSCSWGNNIEVVIRAIVHAMEDGTRENHG